MDNIDKKVQEKYSCDKCDMASFNKEIMEKHKKVDHSENMEECLEFEYWKCGKTFLSKQKYIKHRDDAHTSPPPAEVGRKEDITYICDRCGYNTLKVNKT